MLIPRVDTEANWASVNPTLADRTVMISSDKSASGTGSNIVYYYKYADGVNTWSALPYVGVTDIPMFSLDADGELMAGTAVERGYSGYSGTAGSTGTSGYSGTVGTSGYSGVGTSGYSGVGTSGYSGEPGTSGYSGIDGASGYSGIDGASGYSGEVGASGYSGEMGYSGYSGSV